MRVETFDELERVSCVKCTVRIRAGGIISTSLSNVQVSGIDPPSDLMDQRNRELNLHL